MKARIYQKVENNMQRGRANGKGWRLDYNVPYACRADPLTGWQGSGDTQGQVQLTFPSLDLAVAYANQQGIEYEILKGGARSLKIQSYAGNFAGGDIEIGTPD